VASAWPGLTTLARQSNTSIHATCIKYAQARRLCVLFANGCACMSCVDPALFEPIRASRFVEVAGGLLVREACECFERDTHEGPPAGLPRKWTVVNLGNAR
jgi:hypothetical protein